MTLDVGVLFAVVILLGLNQAMMRVDALWRRSAVFFGTTILMILAGTWVLAVGMPGFEHLPAVRWVLGLLLFMHVAQDLSVRGKRLAAEAEAAEAAARREAIREGLRGGDAEA